MIYFKDKDGLANKFCCLFSQSLVTSKYLGQMGEGDKRWKLLSYTMWRTRYEKLLEMGADEEQLKCTKTYLNCELKPTSEMTGISSTKLYLPF